MNICLSDCQVSTQCKKGTGSIISCSQGAAFDPTIWIPGSSFLPLTHKAFSALNVTPLANIGAWMQEFINYKKK
jgi:hypothetical protein